MHRPKRIRAFVAFVAAFGSTLALPARGNAQAISALKTLVKGDSTYLFPVSSADGKWLLASRELSNADSRLLIGAGTGGPLRELPLDRGYHLAPMLAPAGDRLVFISSAPRRSSTDNLSYLVSAPFDSKSGAITGPIRQVSLEGVRIGPRLRPVISPDGKWVAFVTCCSSADELRIVPITGGTSRLIARGGGIALQRPANFMWGADSRSLAYTMRDGAIDEVREVQLTATDVGAPKVIARITGAIAAISPDRKLFALAEPGPRPKIRLVTGDNRELASLSTPQRVLFLRFTPDGQRLVGANNDGGNTLKIVSASAGTIRTIGAERGNDWPAGWDASAITVIDGASGRRPILRSVSPDGATTRSAPMPTDREAVWWHDHLLFEERVAGTMNRVRLVAQHPATGAKRVLVRDALGGCCDPVGPGGNYWQSSNEELLVRTMRGKQVEIRGIRFDGTSRVVGVLPVGLPTSSFAAVHGNKLAFTEVAGDSLRLRIIAGQRQAPRTIMTAAVQPGIGEFAWSHSGRMLAMYTNGSPQRIRIFRFDAAGAVVGDPQVIDSPFEYFYEMFWRPDDSGLSMIAQPKGSKFSEIAVLPLADPGNPLVLTRNDPSNKWGHSPSPDGKWIAYPSEWIGGGTIVEVDVAKLLKRSPGQR